LFGYINTNFTENLYLWSYDTLEKEFSKSDEMNSNGIIAAPFTEISLSLNKHVNLDFSLKYQLTNIDYSVNRFAIVPEEEQYSASATTIPLYYGLSLWYRL